MTSTILRIDILVLINAQQNTKIIRESNINITVDQKRITTIRSSLTLLLFALLNAKLEIGKLIIDFFNLCEKLY